MHLCAADGRDLDPGTRDFYRHSLLVLREARVPFLVGGGYALDHYTGIGRRTKDFDLFLRAQDFESALGALAAAGYHTERTFHWIGKIHCGDELVDLIYSAVNGVPRVDDEWFEHAIAAEILGVPVALCPPEELIWAKSFVMERERYDGADVIHLLRACGRELDWPRLLRRFNGHWRLLFSHLVLFGFVYPAERSYVPDGVMRALLGLMQAEMSGPAPAERLCQGPLLSWRQYLVDVERWGYQDARLSQGYMTPDEIAEWTQAFRDG